MTGCHTLLTPRKKVTVFFPLLFVLGLSPAADAAEVNEPLILQQQRQKALEQQLNPSAPDVRLSPPSSGFGRLSFPAEKPCFPISQVILSGGDALPHWLPLQRIASQATGHCLGGERDQPADERPTEPGDRQRLYHYSRAGTATGSEKWTAEVDRGAGQSAQCYPDT